MKCPYCDYVHGWSGVEKGKVEGLNGGFFKLPIEVKRSRFYACDEEKDVYACPSCGKLFIEV